MTEQYLENKIEELEERIKKLEKRIEVLENKKTTPKKMKKKEKEYTAGYENITKDPFCGEGW